MFRRPFLALPFALCLLVVFASAPAGAGRPKQTQTEATFLSWDPGTHTITVKVKRTGRGKGPKPPPQLRIKRGEEATFKVKESGSVLTSTIVKSKQGTRMGFEDLAPGSRVFVFWVPDDKDANARFARSISIYTSSDNWKGSEDYHPPAKAAD